jgi:hypothetical protein
MARLQYAERREGGREAERGRELVYTMRLHLRVCGRTPVHSMCLFLGGGGMKVASARDAATCVCLSLCVLLCVVVSLCVHAG